MDLEKIKTLILSSNPDDNRIGYSFLKDVYFKDIRALFKHENATGGSIRITRETDSGYRGDYELNGKFHIHDYGSVVYIYPGNAYSHHLYIQL